MTPRAWGQSVAIFIAILGLVSLSSGFSLIVVMVLYIEREFVPYIDGFVLMVEGFGLFFYIVLVCVTLTADLIEGLNKFYLLCHFQIKIIQVRMKSGLGLLQ